MLIVYEWVKVWFAHKQISLSDSENVKLSLRSFTLGFLDKF